MTSPEPSARPTRRVRVCPDLEAYASLLPDPFGRELFALTNGTSLDTAMFDLVSAWRSASDAHALPAALGRAVPDGLKAFLRTDRTRGMLTRALRDLADRAGIVSGLPLSAVQRKAIRREVEKIVRGVERDWPAAEEHVQALTVVEAWQSYLEESAFRSSIVGLEFFAFTTLYFSYETFVGAVLTGVTKRPAPRKAEVFRDTIAEEFGIDAARELWDHPIVRAARDIRNAHVHRADRLRPDEVEHVAAVMPCESGFALVTAIETRALLEGLRPRVTSFVRLALTKLGERATPLPTTPASDDVRGSA